jgi:hypothetical protein
MRSLISEPLAAPEDDTIHETLNAIGVTYRHRNDQILQPSRIEEVRARNAVRVSVSGLMPSQALIRYQEKRRRTQDEQKTKTPTGSGKAHQGSPQPQSPPKRKHHKPAPNPQTKHVFRSC